MKVFIFALFLLVVAIEKYKYSSLKNKTEKARQCWLLLGKYVTQLKT